MISKLVFPTLPLTEYPADELLLPERQRACRYHVPVTPTPVVRST